MFSTAQSLYTLLKKGGYNGLSDIHNFPDIATASEDYMSRFDGVVGRWLLDCQDQGTLALLKGDALRVLDVGGGHGQNVEAITGAGHDLTVLGSDHGARKLIEDDVADGRIAFETGSFLSIPFDDRSFDALISYRMMCHIHDVDGFMDELSRVADQRVVVDFPPSMSFNILYSLTFWAKKRAEKNTREYRVFSEKALYREFEKRGFILESTYKQFFFPMVLHRIMRLKSLSTVLEEAARFIGVTRLFGSPVIACFVRSTAVTPPEN